MSDTDGVTNVTTPQFTGTCVSGAAVTFTLQGAQPVLPVPCIDGTYRVSLPMTYGPITIAASQIRYGIASAVSATTDIRIDDTPPIVVFSIMPDNPQIGPDANFLIDGLDVSPPVTFECSLDGEPFASCAVTISFPNIPAGDHAFRVRATDAAGNVSAPSLYAWTVGSSWWLSAKARPCPGMCLTTGSTPPARRPSAAARPSRATTAGSLP